MVKDWLLVKSPEELEYFSVSQASFAENAATSYLVHGTNTKMSVKGSGFDNIHKSDYGKPKLRIIYNIKEKTHVSLKRLKNNISGTHALLDSSDITMPDVIIPTGKYSFKLNDSEIDSGLDLQCGGVYRLMVIEADGRYIYKLFTLTPPNSVHMLWILPQFIVLTVAEMFFSVTGLEFTFMQAPNSMKSITSSVWFLTRSMGDLLVIFFCKLLDTDNRAITFFSYSGLMLSVMVIFTVIATKYEYVQIVTEESGIDSNGTTNEGFKRDDD